MIECPNIRSYAFHILPDNCAQGRSQEICLGGPLCKIQKKLGPMQKIHKIYPMHRGVLKMSGGPCSHVALSVIVLLYPF